MITIYYIKSYTYIPISQDALQLGLSQVWDGH